LVAATLFLDELILTYTLKEKEYGHAKRACRLTNNDPLERCPFYLWQLACYLIFHLYKNSYITLDVKLSPRDYGKIFAEQDEKTIIEETQTVRMVVICQKELGFVS